MPFLALGLPISRGTKLGWIFFVFSCLFALFHFYIFLESSDYTYLDGGWIDYNLKKNDFAIFVSFGSILIFSLLFHWFIVGRIFSVETRSFFQSSVISILILGLSFLTYFLTLAVIRNQNWGRAQCEIAENLKGEPYCASAGVREFQ